MDYNNIVNDLIEITNSLDATTETLVGLQEITNSKDGFKKIDIALFLEAPIQELSRLANRLANLTNELEKTD